LSLDSDVEFCEKHGWNGLWLVCDHIITNEAEGIYIAENNVAICFRCVRSIKKLSHKDFVQICGGCLRDHVGELLQNAHTEGDINKMVHGIERLGNREKWI